MFDAIILKRKFMKAEMKTLPDNWSWLKKRIHIMERWKFADKQYNLK